MSEVYTVHAHVDLYEYSPYSDIFFYLIHSLWISPKVAKSYLGVSETRSIFEATPRLPCCFVKVPNQIILMFLGNQTRIIEATLRFT